MKSMSSSSFCSDSCGTEHPALILEFVAYQYTSFELGLTHKRKFPLQESGCSFLLLKSLNKILHQAEFDVKRRKYNSGRIDKRMGEYIVESRLQSFSE
jgi:hypothetical protein